MPPYPWDDLAPLTEKASAFPGGAIDLSLGSPTDPVPSVVQEALAAAADAPGYPTTAGTPELREAAAGWLARTLDVHVPPTAVLPVAGTKELIAWLPTQLGLGPGDTVIYPELAYPTYEVGARLAGATPMASDGLDDGTGGGASSEGASSEGASSGGIGNSGGAGGPARLHWINSPSNPTGRVLPTDRLREAVARARDRGCVLASDECYISLGWEATPTSALHPAVRGDSLDGVLAVFSLSKRSNLAGYRAGFIAGDPELIASLLLIRKQSGMIVPKPVQAAMTAALNDDAHADEQKERYRARREILRDGLEEAGFRIEHSEAGLYLWASRPGTDGRTATELLAAECGILVGPGYMYGPSGAPYIRVALTASDERVAAAAGRLRALAAPLLRMKVPLLR
ncbi:MAG: succinyldiaminopimelate transaminase, partial [Nocardiopsaceae bacterium]|nr:succinyldiaminopimelate transaminase [Nocardiopsaceae bacterium]